MSMKYHIMPNVFIVMFDISKKKNHYTWKELYVQFTYFVTISVLNCELIITMFTVHKLLETKVGLKTRLWRNFQKVMGKIYI